MTTRLATPGAVLLLVGIVLMWWGAGIFRAGYGSPQSSQSSPPDDGHDQSPPGFGGGSSGGGGGGSGSF